MSVGNLKTQGNQGNNFPYQLRVLQLLGEINTGISALPGPDYENRTSAYEALVASGDYSVGDIIIRYDIIDVSVSPAVIVSTLWFNETTQVSFTIPPNPSDLSPIKPTYPLPPNPTSGYVENISDIISHTLLSPVGSALYVTQVLVTNAHPTVGTVVYLLEGGTKIYSGYAAPAGGGFSIDFPTPLALLSGNDLEMSCATAGASVYVSANGFSR